MPATFGSEKDVTTLKVTLEDERSKLQAVLSYSIFKDSGAIARSVELTNNGNDAVEIERLASWSGDLQIGEWEMVQLCGDWAREGIKVRRPIYHGTQG